MSCHNTPAWVTEGDPKKTNKKLMTERVPSLLSLSLPLYFVFLCIPLIWGPPFEGVSGPGEGLRLERVVGNLEGGLAPSALCYGTLGKVAPPHSLGGGDIGVVFEQLVAEQEGQTWPETHQVLGIIC